MTFIDALSERIGRTVAWLTGLMGAIVVVVVVLRYGFDQGAIALQESVMYLHATCFMLGIAYTFKHDEHVRVDIFYSHLSERGKAWANLLGHLIFLLPCTVTVLVSSIRYVGASWAIFEGSAEVGGIPGIFLLKTLIPVMAVLLLLQGVVEIIRTLRVLRPVATGPAPAGTDPAEADSG